MKAVRIKLYQNMVNYRREMSYGYVQTYPLPTPSMIRGMAHALLELNEYKNLKISIQGKHESVVTNMQKIIKFDRDPKARPTNPFLVKVGNSLRTATTGVMFVDEMVNVDLLAHIAFNDEYLNADLLNAIKSKTVILGRNEDIARVDFDETKLVDVSLSENENRLLNNIFLTPDICRNEGISGTHYRLPFYYEGVKSFDDKRIFKFVDCVYVAKGNKLQYTDVLMDNFGDVVNFLQVV